MDSSLWAPAAYPLLINDMKTHTGALGRNQKHRRCLPGGGCVIPRGHQVAHTGADAGWWALRSKLGVMVGIRMGPSAGLLHLMATAQAQLSRAGKLHPSLAPHAKPQRLGHGRAMKPSLSSHGITVGRTSQQTLQRCRTGLGQTYCSYYFYHDDEVVRGLLGFLFVCFWFFTQLFGEMKPKPAVIQPECKCHVSVGAAQLGVFSRGAPRAAGNADAPPAQPNPISPPPPRGSATGSAIPVSSPGLRQDGLWCHPQRLFLEEPATPGMSVWLVCGCLYGGDRGNRGCGKSFGVSRAGLVFTQAKQNHVSCAQLWFCLWGELGRGGRRRGDEPALRDVGHGLAGTGCSGRG